MTDDKLRMNAYYYSFSETGTQEVDVILSAVACAGKAYHHTDCWTEECDPWQSCHRGASPAEWIQRAAEDAALALSRARSDRNAVIAACRQELATGSAVGSAQTLARKILALCGDDAT